MWFLINPLRDSLPLHVKSLIRKYPAVKQVDRGSQHEPWVSNAKVNLM